jgi:hypothetical protein
MKIERVQSITWMLDGKPVLVEKQDGTSEIPGWYALTRDSLRLLLIVLQELAAATEHAKAA